jgi:copper chaperone CopZ
MNAHTVTVSFDDEKQTIEAVVDALADAGYVARNPKKLTQ